MLPYCSHTTPSKVALSTLFPDPEWLLLILSSGYIYYIYIIYPELKIRDYYFSFRKGSRATLKGVVKE